MTNQRGTSPLFVLVALIAVVAALAIAKEILLPLALAVLLSFLLTPLANRIERWGIPRIPAVLLVVALAFTPLGILGWIVTNQVMELTRALPAYRSSIVANVAAKVRSIRPNSNTLNTVSETIEDLGHELTIDGDDDKPKTTEDAEPGAADSTDGGGPRPIAPSDSLPSFEPVVPTPVDKPAGETVDEVQPVPVKVVEVSSPLDEVRNWFGPVVAPLGTAGMVVVMVIFMLLDRESQRNRLIQLFGKSNLHVTTEAFHDAAQRVGNYLRMLFLMNMGYGIAVAIGLWLIEVPSAITWGFLGFVLRFLPYIGPWAAASMPILVSIAVTDGWTQPLLIMGMYVVYELLLNNVAEPLLYGSSVGVSAVGVILAAIFWTWIWGPIGLILAMPMTVCLVVLSRYVPQLRFIHVLLADQPPLTLSERVYQRLLAFDDHEPLKVARTQLKSSNLMSFYDEVLIPALVLAEQDRHAGSLNADQEEFIHEAAGELVEELQSFAAAKADSDAAVAAESAVGRILCVPLRDEADEIASRMLAQLLVAEGFRVDTDAAEALTSEVVDRVAKLSIDVVVISILPPIAPRDSRLLWKRLRSRYPELPIIVGFWNRSVGSTTLLPPEHDHATKVATTLAEAVQLVRSKAAEQHSLEKSPTQSPESATV